MHLSEKRKRMLIFDICVFGAITLQLLVFILVRYLPVSADSMNRIYMVARLCSIALILGVSFYRLKHHFSTEGRYLNQDGYYEVCPYCGANVQGKEKNCQICGKNMYEKNI